MTHEEWDKFVAYAQELRPHMRPQPEYMYFLYRRHGERIESIVAHKAFEEYVLEHPDDRFGNKAWGAFTAHVSAPSLRGASPTDVYGLPSNLKAVVVKQSRAFSSKTAKELQLLDSMLSMTDEQIYEAWMRQEYPGYHSRVNGYQMEFSVPTGQDESEYQRGVAEWQRKAKRGHALAVLRGTP